MRRDAPEAGQPTAGPRPERGQAVIERPPSRSRRAAVFEAYLLVAACVFIVLAVIAHTVAYFPVDLTVTRTVQSWHGGGFDGLMRDISWLGYYPQVAPLLLAVVGLVFACGLRWEAIAALFATASGAVGALIKVVVLRPRPDINLVHVLRELNSPGFPSGHVLGTTAFCGFFVFLCFTLPRPSAWRSLLVAGLLVFIALMGLSRIYLGAHWFSDVMGAYLLGTLWLALTVRFYRWGKKRWFVHQPVAPSAPPTSSVGTA